MYAISHVWGHICAQVCLHIHKVSWCWYHVSSLLPTTLFTEARSLVEPNKSLWVGLVKLASLPWGSCLNPPSAEITSIRAWLPYESWGSKLQDTHTLLGKCFNPTESSPQLSFYKILSEVSLTLSICLPHLTMIYIIGRRKYYILHL